MNKKITKRKITYHVRCPGRQIRSRSNGSKKEIQKMAVLLAVFCVLLLLPMKTEAGQPYTEADLDDGGIEWSLKYSISGRPVDVKIEQGEKFDIGKYLIYNEKSGDLDNYNRKTKHLPLNMIKGTKYISSAPKVISVDNKGRVQTKKTGKATIKVSLASAKYTINVKVVKKGSLPEKEEAKYLEREVEGFKKSIPQSLDIGNCLKFFYDYRNMELNSKKQLKKIRMDGTIQEYRNFGRMVEVSIVVPEAGDFVYSAGLLKDYYNRLNIFERRDSGYMEVISMTSDSTDNTITLKLKEPLNADQVFCLKYITWKKTGFYKKDNRENACNYYIQQIKDKTEDNGVMGSTEAVLGSDTFVVKLIKYIHERKSILELPVIIGHTYLLEGFEEEDVMMRPMKTVVE